MKPEMADTLYSTPLLPNSKTCRDSTVNTPHFHSHLATASLIVPTQLKMNYSRDYHRDDQPRREDRPPYRGAQEGTRPYREDKSQPYRGNDTERRQQSRGSEYYNGPQETRRRDGGYSREQETRRHDGGYNRDDRQEMRPQDGRYQQRENEEDVVYVAVPRSQWTANVSANSTKQPMDATNEGGRQAHGKEMGHQIRCNPEEGGCNGLGHSARGCFTNPASSYCRLSEFSHKSYIAGCPIASHAYQKGVRFVNPSVQQNDKLIYCILPATMFNEELGTPGHIEMPVTIKKVGPNVVWVKRQEPLAANVTANVTANVAIPADPKSPSTSGMPSSSENGQQAAHGQTTQQAEQIQQQARMATLEQQLEQIKKSLEGGEGKGKARIVPPNAPPHAAPEDQAEAIPPEQGTHIPANVGHWIPSKGPCKWTAALVKELIGDSVIQRKGLYYIYTSHFHQSAVTEQLEGAFSASTPALCAAALKAAKLPVKDVKDLHANQEEMVIKGRARSSSATR